MNNYSETFYRDFGLTALPKAFLKNQEIYNLFTKPLTETKLDMPKKDEEEKILFSWICGFFRAKILKFFFFVFVFILELFG